MAFKKLSPDTIRKHKGISFPGITTVFLCHDGKGKIFLAKRSKNARDEHGRWDVGGGGLKHGHTAEGNLRREVLEEYNATVKSVEFLGYLDVFRETDDGTPTHWLALLFTAQVDPKEVRINEPDMFDEHGWFSLDALPSPMHSKFYEWYEKHSQQIQQIINQPL